MSGFDKIEFKDKSTPSANTQVRSGRVKSTPDFAKSQSTVVMPKRNTKTNFNFFHHKASKPLLIALGVIIILVVLISIPAYATYKAGLQTYREAKLIAAAAKQQNVDLASDEIAKTQTLLNKTKTNFHYLLPLKLVPIINWYYNDADHLLNAASYGLDSAQTIATSLKPYADVLGLKGSAGGTGSTSNRIKTAVLSLSKITPSIDKIGVSLTAMQGEMDQVDPNHYPTFLFGKTIQSQLAGLKTFTDESAVGINDAKPLIKTLPSLLGASEPKQYLVIFQNDKELRPTGGFITAYAIFDVDQGTISLVKSDDIYNLDNSIPDKPPAPAPILKYFSGVYEFNLRDSNISPDYMVSMKTFNDMYNKAGLKTVPIDGIIAIDTNVLVSTIKILDNQVEADGQTFTTDTDPHCACPQVIYALENSISRPVNYVKTARKSLISDLMQAIMVKSLQSSPKKYWGPLFQSMITGTQQKDILFDLFDPQAQQGIESLNAAGQIQPFNGDYLHINDTNFSGAKVNIFLSEAVTNAYSVASDGTITKTVTIAYKDPFPPSDCSLKDGGLCLNAEYRDWLRLYVPQGSQLVNSTGSQIKINTYNELGKTVFEGFVTVRPEGFNTFSITYTLPFKLKSGSPLPLMIQKQPGATNNPYTITVNGNTVNQFTLSTDKTLTVNF